MQVRVTFLKGLFWTTHIKLHLLAPSRTPSSWFISKKHEADFTKQCWYSLEPPEHRGNCHIQLIAKLSQILVRAAFSLKSTLPQNSIRLSFILSICLWATAQICHHRFSLILQLYLLALATHQRFMCSHRLVLRRQIKGGDVNRIGLPRCASGKEPDC